VDHYIQDMKDDTNHNIHFYLYISLGCIGIHILINQDKNCHNNLSIDILMVHNNFCNLNSILSMKLYQTKILKGILQHNLRYYGHKKKGDKIHLYMRYNLKNLSKSCIKDYISCKIDFIHEQNRPLDINLHRYN
jgi:hypothetical protein